MAVKMSGFEFKKFWNDSEYWPGKDGETYVEEEEITVNDVVIDELVDPDSVKDTDIVVINGGYINSDNESIDGRELEKHFKLWKKKQSKTTFLVECDKSNLDGIKSAILAAGGKVVL